MTEHYVYGLHAVTALLQNPHRKIRQLFVANDRQDQRMNKLLALAASNSVATDSMSMQKLNLRFPDAIHQGVVALASPLPDFNESHLLELLAACEQAPLILILDGVTDPHNLGACLRTADAAGVDFVIIPKDRNASVTPVVSKVACGAAESMPLVRVTNLARAMEIIKQEGVWIYGAAGEATSLVYQIDYRTASAIVMGAEGDGMRRLTREHCDELFSLPMCGTVESLNVSVATGVALYEVVRQRRLL